MFKNLNTKILASIFLLLCIVIAAATFTMPLFNKFAEALNTTDYVGKTQLFAGDWSRLPADFVAKSGDTMTGPLTLGGPLTLPGDPTLNMQAATKQYVDNVANPMKDINGNNLKMVCGSGNAWHDWSTPANTIYVDINYPASTFTSDPKIFLELSGNSQNFWTLKSVYPLPAHTDYLSGFRAYVWNGNYFNEMGVTTHATDVVGSGSWNWVLNWCAVGR